MESKMKNFASEFMLEAERQVNIEGHDVYSRAEVVAMLTKMREQLVEGIGEVETGEKMKASQEFLANIRKAIVKFDYDFSFELDYENRVQAEVCNADDLADEIVEMITDED